MGRFLLCFTNVFDFDLRVCGGGEGREMTRPYVLVCEQSAVSVSNQL